MQMRAEEERRRLEGETRRELLGFCHFGCLWGHGGEREGDAGAGAGVKPGPWQWQELYQL